MPNRILKESICRSEDVDALSLFEEVLFYRLIVSCDDFGRFDGRPKIIKAYCFPLKNITDKDIDKALRKLEAVGLIVMYEVDGKPYLYLKKWADHQRVRNQQGKYPAPNDKLRQIAADCGELQQIAASCGESRRVAADCSGLRPESNPIQSESELESESESEVESESERESKPESECGVYPSTQYKAKKPAFRPPTVEQVQAYCEERRNGVDAQRFVDFYASKGWMIGKNRMKDWKSAVRTWERPGDGGGGGSPRSSRQIDWANV